LGKRLGGTVADWISRAHLRRKVSDPAKADLSVEVDETVIVLELDEGLPDEARIALLDLDIDTQAVRGRRLTWNAELGAWVPTDAHG
jgi:hypothetical protein